MAAPTDATAAPTRSKLTLKGSAKLVSEFFEFTINSILYQRGIYPPEDFKAVKKYGLTMMVTDDEDVKAYIKKIMGQLHKWVTGGKITKLIVAVTSKETAETVERWQFALEINNKNPVAPTTPSKAGSAPPAADKPEAEITKEIQALIRQITASVTFLPQLEGLCTFNVLVYADNDSEVPAEWVDSDAKEVVGAEAVQMRSFSTKYHAVSTLVEYKMPGEE
ncbi:DNA-binding protein [Saitoella complicata NRRL Y-17804]|uniref:HORMA domain-containing protein n=1 Tax=Saitoella complicata (strain BCRC 22490 / CBS 7301 / JCM 7358 / NBRC 10748 / NRRL Y-17804) TaxID=698492 RepID=A0A0E9NQK1_SAICN|nr:DNA-binding protein [Saitoella complicata NRRL Y-17804]ODQ50302.1 DNA-binding protein [Saitoella complicata NRRL Y-17804]GAO52129.1 hypothetical protein G7K_6215-t1 [Saitoella complicata NRRL Y-17804]